MPRFQYGVPLDLYADDEDLDPLKGSPLEPEMAFDLPGLKQMQYAALDEAAKPQQAEEEPVALTAATMGTGGSGPPARAPAAARAPVRGYGAGLGGEDLARAQGQDKARNAARDTSDALYATFARKEMPQQRATSDAANLVQRRAGVDQEEALVDRQNTRQAKLAQEAEWRNPASDGNVAMREALKGTGLAPDLVNSPQFERMTKPHLEAVYGKDFVGKLMLLANRAKAAKAPKNSPESLAAFRAAAIKSHPKLDPQLVNSLDSVDDINKLMTDERAAEAAQASITAAGVGAGREQRRYERDLGDKERHEIESVQIPGLSISPEAHPSTDDAKKVKASLASKERMGRYIKELRAIHAAKGTELFGADANRMQQLYKQILVEGKNIAELGALSGPDMGLIQDIIGEDPGGLSANLKGAVGVDNTQARLDGLQKWVDETSAGNEKAYGYGPKSKQRPASTGRAADTVMVTPPGGGSPVPVHRSKLDAAIRAGGKVIDG